MKYIIFTIIIYTIASLITITYSYIHPWELEYIDNLRIKLQQWIITRTHTSPINDIYVTHHPQSIMPQPVEVSKYLADIVTYLQPGDLILTRNNTTISNIQTPWYRKHIALYIWWSSNSNKNHQIIDSHQDGVSIRPLTELLYANNQTTIQDIVILRLHVNTTQKQDIINAALEHLGKQYDYDLRIDETSALYCSELISIALRTAHISIQPQTEIIGRRVITPQEIFDQLTTQWSASIIQTLSLIKQKNGR